MNTQLSDYTRAVDVAKGYAFYRIANIKLRIKSPYDTFINGGPAGTGGYQKPYFYYMIDKSGGIPTNVQLEGLKQMGARPRVMDEKSIVVSWKPSVLDFSATSLPTSVGFPNHYKLSPWLSTNNIPQSTPWTPSQVDHLGIYWGAFASLVGTAPNLITYDVEVEVQFQFKKPIVSTPIGAVNATPATYALTNTSVDGVVGGPDGE